MTSHLAPGHPLRRVQRRAYALGAVAAAACVLGAARDPGQFLRSYLVAYLFLVGLALGCLAILMLHHVGGGAWGAVIRRPVESGARTLPLLAVLFLPIALGVGRLYEWARPEAVAHDPLLQHKQLYLNVPFFLARAVFYFAAWIAVTRVLDRWSVEQDATGDPAPGHRMEQLSRGGLVLLGLTMTFASIDWMMSLEPHWFSTIYGVLFMGGSVLTAMAFVIPLTAVLAREGPLARVAGPEVFHDLGKLLLAFVMLWGYFAYSQFLITWAGNLTEEIPWYLRRLHGGWQWLALGVVGFHFALPFVLLLSRDLKRRARSLAAVAVVLIVMRFADVYWMVTPAFRPAGASFHWLDVATVAALGGAWLGWFVRQLDGRPLVARNDPALPGEA